MTANIAMSALDRSSTAGPPTFELDVRPQREVVQLRLVGELDATSTARLRAEVDELVSVGFIHVVIDLRGLLFMDCAGLRALLALGRVARRESWRLSLVQGSDPVRRLFALTATLDVLPFISPAAAWGARTGIERHWRPDAPGKG
jgi:anti-sigma B factor antagonist